MKYSIFTINGAFPLGSLGYDDRYYLFDDGEIFDINRHHTVRHKENIFSLLLADGTRERVSLKTLYR